MSVLCVIQSFLRNPDFTYFVFRESSNLCVFVLANQVPTAVTLVTLALAAVALATR